MAKLRYDPKKGGTHYAPGKSKGDVIEVAEEQIEGYLQAGCWELVEEKPKASKPKAEDKKGAD